MTTFNPGQGAGNRLVSASVIALETLLVGVVFLLFCVIDTHKSLGELLQWGSSETQIALVLLLCYALSSSSNGVILHRRSVRTGQVVAKVSENLIIFVIIGGIFLLLGRFIRSVDLCMVAYVVCLWMLFCLLRVSLMRMIRRYRRKVSHNKATVLVGSSSNNRALFHEMTTNAETAYSVAGYFDDEPNPKFKDECNYLGTPEQVIDYLKANSGIHYLFCCLPSSRADIIVPIIEYCENNLVHFFSVPNVRNYVNHRMYLNLLGDVPYLSLRDEPLERVENRFVKRAFDIVVSGLFLCTLFLIVLVIVAIVTKLTMPGPIFFRQKRNGINGKEFTMFKFRSMKVNNDADTVQATKDDPRITKWGAIMRKTNIDELPQFINVFIGDMSIVGPRPHMVKHTSEYSHLVEGYMVRHFVKPGVTGWSQVTGFRGETKELTAMEGRVKGDVWYIEHWSFGLDIYIICMTVLNTLRGEEKAC